MAERMPTYLSLLEEALELGRLDGWFAAAFEPTTSSTERADRSFGRTPEEFAALLWGHLSGSPPAGLEQNAPRWYAIGFAEGVEARRRELRAAERTRTRRVLR